VRRRKRPLSGGYAIAISKAVQRLPLSERAARAAAALTLAHERADSAMLSIAFVGKAAITRLNKAYLGRIGATDVLSFSLQSPGNDTIVIGDIYICPEVARANARRQGVTLREELLRLVVHGVLHSLGNDHPDGERRTSSPMWRKQESILAGIA
jgi:probable rRNA maturation factor